MEEIDSVVQQIDQIKDSVEKILENEFIKAKIDEDAKIFIQNLSLAKSKLIDCAVNTAQEMSEAEESLLNTSGFDTSQLISIYVQSREMKCLELSSSSQIKDIVDIAVKSIKKQIANNFQFYLYVSKNKLNWNFDSNGTMKEQVQSDIFRMCLAPELVAKTVSEIRQSIRADLHDHLHFYVFIKRVINDEDNFEREKDNSWISSDLTE